MPTTQTHLNGHTERVHWPRSMPGRFVTGHPISGYWNTNATYWLNGIASTGRREPYTNLAWQAGYKRFLLRWSVVGWVVEVATFNVLDGMTDLQTLTVDSAPVLVGAAFAAGRVRAHRERALKLTENAVRDNVRSILGVERPLVVAEREGKKVTSVAVSIPRRMPVTAASIRKLTDAVHHVVGADWDVERPDLTTSRMLSFHRPIDVDEVLTYDAVRDVMLAQEPGNLYLGHTRQRQPVTVNLDTDSPHILYSASTGRGKSATLRLMIAQLLEQGAWIDICDVGRFSLSEFKGVDGVTVTTNVAKIQDVIEGFAQEMGERMDEVELQPWNEQDEYRKRFTRKVLVIEEGNSFYAQVVRYWEQTKPQGAKAKPPVFGTLSEVLSMARKVRMHVLLVGQRIGAEIIGGGNNRENFGVRLLANPSLQTWKMFAEGKLPAGARTRKAGVVVLIFAGEQEIVKQAFLTQAEALEHASNPRVPFVLPSYVPGEPVTSENAESDLGHGTPVSLSDATELTGRSLDALRKAAQREGFPAPVGVGSRGAKLYDPTDLVRALADRTTERTES